MILMVTHGRGAFGEFLFGSQKQGRAGRQQTSAAGRALNALGLAVAVETPHLNLTQSLLQALKARGATEVFGIPGDFALPLFREMEHAALLPVHTLSHEPGVGFAASAAARARGGLGVAAVTYGAGAFNLVNAVAGAYAERVPLVVLSGAPAAHEAASGYLLHHQVETLDSQWRLFEELRRVDHARLDDAARARPTASPACWTRP